MSHPANEESGRCHPRRGDGRPPQINALQRGSTVILQKSLKEGLGLTVTEALWKGKSLVASAVGGIPLQVKNGITGLLTHTIEGAAQAILRLLADPDLAKRLGQNGREHVRQNFLVTRHPSPLPWSEIKNVVCARIETVDSQPIIEIHVGPRPLRLRIFKPVLSIFNYVGRRRELSVAANMTLIAKDLIRFGPGIRASHGLRDLFSERNGPGSRFLDLISFEEYVFWFRAMRTEPVQRQWQRIRDPFQRRVQ